MENQLINFETAKLAKEKGFNEKCVSYYVLNYSTFKATKEVKNFSTPIEDNKNILQLQNLSVGQPHLALAPTQSLLQKWLRDKYDIDILCIPSILGYELRITERIDNPYRIQYVKITGNNLFQHYEECLEAGLLESLNYIKLCEQQ